MKFYYDAHTHKRPPSHTKAIVNWDGQGEMPEIFSTGVHPWFLDIPAADFSHPQCMAIGETGLDRLHPYFERQKSSFIRHIKISQKLNKPLIIHSVRSYSDILEILKKESFKGRFLLHDYNGNQKITEEFLKWNAYFGIGRKIFQKRTTLYKNLESLPHSRILIETDDSSLSIEKLYEKAKGEIKISPFQIQKNFHDFLNLDLERK